LRISERARRFFAKKAFPDIMCGEAGYFILKKVMVESMALDDQRCQHAEIVGVRQVFIAENRRRNSIYKIHDAEYIPVSAHYRGTQQAGHFFVLAAEFAEHLETRIFEALVGNQRQTVFDYLTGQTFVRLQPD